jgi:hypothetical protein
MDRRGVVVVLWCQSLSPDQDSGCHASGQLLAGVDTTQLYCVCPHCWKQESERTNEPGSPSTPLWPTRIDTRRITFPLLGDKSLLWCLMCPKVRSRNDLNLRHVAGAAPPASQSENANIARMDNCYRRRGARPMTSCSEAPTDRQDRGLAPQRVGEPAGGGPVLSNAAPRPNFDRRSSPTIQLL